MNWKTGYDEVCEVINNTDESNLKKNLLKKELKKVIRKAGGLDYKLFPPDFRWNLCAARMRQGDFSNYDGWVFRSDWSMTFHEFNGYKNPLPKWDGTPVKHLVVLGEQGVGDEILFSSALPDLMMRQGLNIEFQCHPRLKNIIKRSFKIKCTDRRNLSEVTEGDAVVALGDLMMFYRHDKSHFPKKPIFKLDPEKEKYWKEKIGKLGDKPKIGIAWKGRKGDLDLKELMFEDAIYINLQYLRHPQGEWEISVPDGVIDLGVDPMSEIEEHIHLISALDKVITTTQTVVHECGSIGKECHTIRPIKDTGEVNTKLWYYGDGNCSHYVWGNSYVYNTIKDYKRSIK